MTHDKTKHAMEAPIVIECDGAAIDELLADEWLVTNQIGAYASQTVTGCNTRRYHALLVATTKPPVGRVSTLAQLHEQIVVAGQARDLSTFEFPNTIHPRGCERLREFVNDVAPKMVFRIGEMTLTKEVILAESVNAVAVRYRLTGGDAELCVRPLVALRDFHHLRKADQTNALSFELDAGWVVVNDRDGSAGPLYISVSDGAFEPGGQWWYNFRYRVDLARGQDVDEDLYAPGVFRLKLADGQAVQLTASLADPRQVDFDDATARRRERLAKLASDVGKDADETSRRLAVATDAFVVRRSFPNLPPSWTILAGYHWFADWGRDAFIALPGLLLSTGRFAQAREVFTTFAEHVSEGMVPNRFDDYSTAAHYNSIDASLWFIMAAERYMEATGDDAFWRSVLSPAVRKVLEHYQSGTRFDIHADGDGLLMGGSYQTQLTWMDAKLGDEAVTPRHGKCVEINAMWYCAHRILARRDKQSDPQLAEHAAGRAEIIAKAFNDAFWNAEAGCLYDCIHDGQADPAIRPNQVFAVSLPFSPLPADRQTAIVQTIADRLLTPMGLQTLDASDPRYRGHYGGSWEGRDRAYHQGTVWAWLMGAFVEAYLKTEQFKPAALAQARKWLAGFDAHLRTTGLGQISEIFDGDAPHTPRGCIAQAWSVGEILRVKRLIDQAQAKR